MRALSALLVGTALFLGGPNPSAPPIARPNDNRLPGGTTNDSGVTFALEARRVMWHPDGDSLPGHSTEAFAEAGHAPTVPGPLVRVRAGTPVRFRVVNADLPDTLRFILAPDLGSDTLVIAPGGKADLRVTPQDPGNYYYRAFTDDAQSQRYLMKGLLGGAFIVDSATSTPKADRILVLNWLVDSIPAGGGLGRDRSVFSINGRSWPHTERITATVGDSLHWRIVSLNNEVHPIHLHGTYFQVDEFLGPPNVVAATGPIGRMVVTERMPPYTTMSITWAPQRPGNWLFHCHFQAHLVPRRLLEQGASAIFARPAESHSDHENHAMTGMAGLVMGIVVNPRPGAGVSEADLPRRHLRLVAVEDSGYPETMPSLRYRLEDSRAGTRTEAGPAFSPPILLTRGEPVSITVVNGMRESTSMHWHGIELESYYDGVADFSGYGTRTAPIIAPRDSFEARFTPPRSGTFIYHSHVNETRQFAAGLVGALIVRDGTAPLENDHTIFLKGARDGRPGNNAGIEINGRVNPDTIVFRAGVSTRLRFISLTLFNPNATVFLTSRLDSSLANGPDSLIVRWKPVAKDGADLPEAWRVPKLARQLVSMGETYDFEYTAPAKGLMRIEVRTAGANGRPLARVPVRVE